MIGIFGAHRVGKSTLAKAAAEKLGIAFLQTDMSGVYKRLGMSPNQVMDADTRIMVQEALYQELTGSYQNQAVSFITDRTPIDLMAYLIFNLPQVLTPEQTQRVEAYVNKCMAACGAYFDLLVQIQPGIQLVEAEGKAVAAPVYVDSLSWLMAGLARDERVKVSVMTFSRSLTNLETRIAAMVGIGKTTQHKIREGQSSQPFH